MKKQHGFTQHYKNNAGFTLIELLVVIAIIGILSAVVLASLNTARTKGNDAAIQSNLSAIRNQAEIYYKTGGTNVYGATSATGVCNTAGSVFVDPVIKKAIDAANVANGSAGTIACNNSTNEYAVSVALASDNARYWCVDSNGGATNSTNALGFATVCPASN